MKHEHKFYLKWKKKKKKGERNFIVMNGHNKLIKFPGGHINS